jgi:hypothetical protein
MATQIVFLFGRPGVGKLTVGELLAADTGYRLLHNHAVVDLVTSLFSFGSPPFVALREKLWLDAVDACIAAKQAGVIMTFAPESTVTDQFIPALKKHVTARRGTLRFIELRCSESELENRLIAESRGKFGKLRDVTQFRQLDKAGAFARPKMPVAELVVDTTDQEPVETARQIALHLRG